MTTTRRLAAVIGSPARHSRSPAIHNAAFEATGLDWVFTAFEAPAGAGAAAMRAMKVMRLGGMSVTMPLKAEAAAAADCARDEVRALGAANCIVALDDGRLLAANTDAAGFVAGLEADAGVSPEGLAVALIGAGGAARAVAWAAASHGAADVAVINRSESKARACAEAAGVVGRVGGHGDISAADVVVNATPLGMGASELMPCDVALLHRRQIVVDLVYEPLETPWLAAARRRGIDAHNGLSMLVFQAASAFEEWTGRPAPVEVMRRAAASSR